MKNAFHLANPRGFDRGGYGADQSFLILVWPRAVPSPGISNIYNPDRSHVIPSVARDLPAVALSKFLPLQGDPSLRSG